MDKYFVLGKIGEIINKVKDEHLVITLDSDMTSLGFDSISFITIIVELESEFECELSDDLLDFRNIKTVGDLVNSIVNGTISL